MDAAVSGGLNPGSQLKPWQLRGLARFSAERQAGHGIIIADKMGYGKTISAIVCACEARAGSGRRPVVFVVPTAVESNWRTEIGHFTNWTRVYLWRECSEAQRALLFAPGSEVDAVVMSHTALSSIFTSSYKKVEVQKFHRKDEDFFRRFYPTDAEHPLFTARHLAAIVIDESHILRNPDTLLYASAMFAGRHSAAWLCLTGTPHQNKIEDCVSQLELCHARPQFTKGGALRKCKAALLEELHRTSLIRDTGPLDLPPLARSTIQLAMPAEEAAVMDALLLRTIEALEEFLAANVGFDHVLVEFLRIRKVSVCLPLLEEDEMAELDRVRDEANVESRGRPPKEERNHAKRALAIMANPSAKLLNSMERIRAHIADGRKAVVFCSFVDPLFAMAEMLNDNKDGTAAVYYGGLTHSQKETVLGQFNSNPECKVLFVSLRSGSTGLNLQVASVAIHMDKWWNPAISDQATHRIWRMGQQRDCVVEYIEYENSFDDACAQLYHSYKQRNADTFLSGKYEKDAQIKFDGSAAASLLEEIATRRGLKNVAARARAVRTALQPEKQAKDKGTTSNRVVSEMRLIRQEQAAADLAKRARAEPPKPTPSLGVHLPSFKPKPSPLAGLRAQFRAAGPRMQYMISEAQRQRLQSSVQAASKQLFQLEECQM